MTRIIFSICALMLLSVASVANLAQSSPQSATREKKMQEMLIPTARIILKENGAGSGTVIYSALREDVAHTYVLTNFHVVETHIVDRNAKRKKKMKKEKNKLLHAYRCNMADKEIRREPRLSR